MSSEYVKLSEQEMLYGQRNFLRAQLDVLELITHYTGYLRARKEEFNLKIELKSRLEEVKNNVIILERMLPRAYPAESEKKNKIRLEKDSKATSSLQQEIDIIKQKLAQLNG